MFKNDKTNIIDLDKEKTDCGRHTLNTKLEPTTNNAKKGRATPSLQFLGSQ